MLKKLGLLALSTIVLGSPLFSIVSASVPDNYVLIKEGSSYIDREDMSAYNLSNYSNFIFVQNYTSVETFGEPLPDSEMIRCAVGSSEVGNFAYSSNYPGSDYFTQIPFSFEYSFGSLSEYIENYGDTDMFFYCTIDAVEDEDNPMGGFVETNRTYSLYGLPVGSSSSDSNGSISIPSGFGDSINGLVSNFVGSIGNYAPTILLVGFGVLVLFTFWGYIRHASSELFTLNRKGNKSLGWFQKEDIVNMYTNWKKDRVSKHDVNKIIENDYDYEDVSKRAEFYADNELRNTDGFYSMSSEKRMEVWGKYKMDYINKHYKKNI